MSFTTQCGTLSFPQLFTPAGFAGQEEKFSTMLIFPEGWDSSALEAVMEAALIKKFGSVPAKWVNPIKDGNEKLDKDGNVRAEFANRKYITCKAKATDAPTVVDKEVQPILDPKEVYGGAEARISVNPFAYEYMGKKGVSLYLKAVQTTGAGEPFGVVTDVTDAFKAPF